MTIKDLLYITSKKLFEKRNIMLMLILIVLLFIIYGCITVSFFIQDFKKSAFENNGLYRELLVSNEEDNYESLKSLEHIEYYINTKFSQTLYNEVPDFDSDITKGEVAIKTLIDPKDINIVDGTNINNITDMVCPKNFYPYSESMEDENTKIYYSKYLDGSSYIGKNITVNPHFVEEYEKEKEPINFKIVGVYETKKNTGTIQTCYVSKDAFDKIYGNIQGIVTYEKNGELIRKPDYFTGVIVRVDKYKNLGVVAQELTKQGFIVSNKITLDTELLDMILSIPFFILIIIIIIALNIIYNFLKKKAKYRSNYLGILKFSGYTNKDILKINLFENSMLLYISIIISFTFYLIAFNIINKYYIYEFIYNNYYLSIPAIYLIIIFVILNILVVLINIKITNSSLKNSIRNLVGES